MRPTQRSAGFSLMELMTTLAITSIVVLMIYSSWVTVLNATESSKAAAQNSHRERMTLEALEQVLSGAAWYKHHTNGPLHLDSMGSFSQLSVISRVPGDFWGARNLGAYPLRRIEFITEPTVDGESQLVMIQQPLLAHTNRAPQIHRTVLLPRVETFSLEVRADPNPVAPWKNNWNGAKGGLPVDARVRLGISAAFPREKSWPLLANLTKHAPPPKGFELIKQVGGLTFESMGITNSPSSNYPKVVFIIDKSLSMAQWGKLEIAKSGAANTGESIFSSKKGHFNYYTFNSRSDRFAPSMRASSPETLIEARQWLMNQHVDKTPGNDGIIDCIRRIFRDSNPTDIYVFADTGFLGLGVEPQEFSEAIHAYNKNAAVVNIGFVGAGERDLNKFIATPTGMEILSVAEKYNGIIYLIE